MRILNFYRTNDTGEKAIFRGYLKLVPYYKYILRIEIQQILLVVFTRNENSLSPHSEGLLR
jgi:hypothetical protein